MITEIERRYKEATVEYDNVRSKLFTQPDMHLEYIQKWKLWLAACRDWINEQRNSND